MQYWLFKTEPHCFGIEDLKKAENRTTSWDGVRNYQARNFMKAMKKGDLGFFYHSGKNPEIVGVVEVVREAYPDHFAWNMFDRHYDPKSTPEKPLWYMVDVKLAEEFEEPLSRKRLSSEIALADMELMRKGSRLSVQPVGREHFEHIMAMAKRG